MREAPPHLRRANLLRAKQPSKGGARLAKAQTLKLHAGNQTVQVPPRE